ncbi:MULTISPECIES: DUF3203 family protein [unclassified Pseudomonas]|uniref:DUF3203 family protein n=1 Tax=unclassified Pseudomonas TaxID=196821 RepID=UPI000D3A7C23|nr:MULTISPECIES: DUF3203 family protein [unclassified Pseudomonas]RAU41468.1 DUF3203 family protein [Pseudomonas sp. RIT 409]RAU53291.1 DUF3203 family protein [Pseudomonas sp. RIT 412]
MPLQFDATHAHCWAVVDQATYRCAVADVVITTNDATHMSEALIDGRRIPITEAEADALTLYNATDRRHHTIGVEPGEDSPVI